jgi:hypothetical protein
MKKSYRTVSSLSMKFMKEPDKDENGTKIRWVGNIVPRSMRKTHANFFFEKRMTLTCVHRHCRQQRHHIYHNTVKSRCIAYQLAEDDNVWCSLTDKHSHGRVTYMEVNPLATSVRRIETVDSEFIPVEVINSQSLVLDEHKLVRGELSTPPVDA